MLCSLHCRCTVFVFFSDKLAESVSLGHSILIVDQAELFRDEIVYNSLPFLHNGVCCIAANSHHSLNDLMSLLLCVLVAVWNALLEGGSLGPSIRNFITHAPSRRHQLTLVPALLTYSLLGSVVVLSDPLAP